MSDNKTFDVECFKKYLKTDHVGRDVVYKRTTTTTMDDALQLAKSGALHGTLILTEAQTAARGYKGHTFNATNTGNIYASFVLHRPLQETNKGYSGIINPEISTALAARKAIDEIGLHSVQLKWVNDLWTRGHKLAGFLVEPSSYVLPDSSPPLELYVLGIGVNVNADVRRDPSLGPIATSVACELGGKHVNREMLLAKLCNQLEINLQKSQEELYKEFLRYSLFHPGDAIFVHDEENGITYNAEVIEIQESWGVLVRNSDGTEHEIAPLQLISLRPRTSQSVVVLHRGDTLDSSCKGLFNLLHCLVDKVSASVKYMDTIQLETGNWQKDTQLLVMDEEEDVNGGRWREDVADTVRAFVRSGGAILCVTHTAEFAQMCFPQLGLKVISMKTNPNKNVSLILEKTVSSPDNVIDGFSGNADSKYFEVSSQADVLAWYSEEIKPAIVSSVFGKGIVCLCGIHIESVQSSLDNLTSSTQDAELFKRDMLLQTILNTCGLK